MRTKFILSFLFLCNLSFGTCYFHRAPSIDWKKVEEFEKYLLSKGYYSGLSVEIAAGVDPDGCRYVDSEFEEYVFLDRLAAFECHGFHHQVITLKKSGTIEEDGKKWIRVKGVLEGNVWNTDLDQCFYVDPANEKLVQSLSSSPIYRLTVSRTSQAPELEGCYHLTKVSTFKKKFDRHCRLSEEHL